MACGEDGGNKASQHASIKQLLAEYETIAHNAAMPGLEDAIRRSGLTADAAETVIASTGWESLAAALRQAQQQGADAGELARELGPMRELDTAGDPASVLHYRATVWLEQHPLKNSKPCSSESRQCVIAHTPSSRKPEPVQPPGTGQPSRRRAPTSY